MIMHEITYTFIIFDPAPRGSFDKYMLKLFRAYYLG